MAADLFVGHPARVHRDDLVVEAMPVRLALGDDLGFETRVAIPGHLDRESPCSVPNVFEAVPLRELPDPRPAGSPRS